MALRPVHLNIKARDHAAIGRFWAGALGWTAHSGQTTYVGPTTDFVWPDPVVIGIDVVPVPDAKTEAKNRTHLDLATASPRHQAELVAHLRDLGATPADIGQRDVPWTVLADPEGNEFCVLEPREVYRDTGPIAAIVTDCTDPRAMARFWAEAIGWSVREVNDDFAQLRSDKGPFIEFLRVPGGRDDRVHLDLLPDEGAKEAEVARLRDLGARDFGAGGFPWTALTDPDGHQFCVLAH